MKKKVLALIVLFLAVILSFSVAAAKPQAVGLKACADGIDNDGDGYTDLDDPGCSSKKDTSELNPEIECDDGTDNDGDGYTDSADTGCTGPTDTDETDCGDTACEGGETQYTCPQDCGYPDSCSDTDGGNVVSVFGTASGYYNNAPYSNSDACVDPSNIVEYYCNGVYETSQQQSCGTDSYGPSYCSADNIY